MHPTTYLDALSKRKLLKCIENTNNFFFQERNSTLQSFLAAEKNQVPNYDYQQKLENETLENLYSPSYWSKRLSQDVSLSRNDILFRGGRGVFLPFLTYGSEHP